MEETLTKYGLELPIGGVCGYARTLADMASLAEESGWDGVFLEDYIVLWVAHDAPTCDPWISLPAMALCTKRIRIGTTVTPLSRRRPWKVAREAVTLDHLSDGRLILGVGLGDVNEPGFTKVGEVTDDKQRAKRLDEALDILAGLWSGKPFTYEGQYYQINEVTFLPKPLQTPRIPIWIGGNWPRKGPVWLAMRWDGFLPAAPPMEPEEVRELRALVQSRRIASGQFDIAIGGRERIADWDQERATIRSLAKAGATWWLESIEPADLDAMRANIKMGPLRID